MDNKRYDRIADLNESNRLLHQANHQLRAKLSSKDAEITSLQADNEALRAALEDLVNQVERDTAMGISTVTSGCVETALDALDRQSEGGIEP